VLHFSYYSWLFWHTFSDPYLNTDAGTMSPIEHGEVYVLDDGGEVQTNITCFLISRTCLKRPKINNKITITNK